MTQTGPARLLPPWRMGGASWSSDEFSEGHSQGVGDEEQLGEAGGALSGLVPVDRLVVEADALAQLDLGEACMSAGFADAVPDDPAAG